jgi:hypothetical protein
MFVKFFFCEGSELTRIFFFVNFKSLGLLNLKRKQNPFQSVPSETVRRSILNFQKISFSMNENIVQRKKLLFFFFLVYSNYFPQFFLHLSGP